MTGAGMLECKKALEEAGGDIEKAKEILRIRGLAKADKKAESTRVGIWVRLSRADWRAKAFITVANMPM